MEKSKVINNTEIVEAFRTEGGMILHFRPWRMNRNSQYTRGMTVAFKRFGSRVEVATAVQHRNDTFSKKLGTKTAIEHFKAGKTVTLPVSSKGAVSDLRYALSALC